MYPHAVASFVTRGEPIFQARNAIDGVIQNHLHGAYPYHSWSAGAKMDMDFVLDFGTKVQVEKIIFFLRADFPHDNWWTQVTLTFSDGSSIDWPLEKSRFAHVLTFEKKKITWIELSNLMKADDPSPFPALTQLEVYGTVVK